MRLGSVLVATLLLGCEPYLVLGTGNAPQQEGGGVHGVFVAVGAGGSVLSSSDGLEWRVAPTGTDRALDDVVGGNGIIVAVGAAGTIVRSGDGEAWDVISAPRAIDLNAIDFDGTRFIAVGGDWSEGAITISSTDGRTWEELPAPASHMLQDVAATTEKRIAVGFYRSDLQTPAYFTAQGRDAWELRAPDEDLLPGPWNPLCRGDGVFVAIRGSDALVSTDGETWAVHALPEGHGARALTWAQGLYIAVEERGDVLTSTDAVTWMVRPLGLQTFYASVASSGTVHVAVGQGGAVLRSTDAASWTESRPVAVDLQSVTFVR